MNIRKVKRETLNWYNSFNGALAVMKHYFSNLLDSLFKDK